MMKSCSFRFIRRAQTLPPPKWLHPGNTSKQHRQPWLKSSHELNSRVLPLQSMSWNLYYFMNSLWTGSDHGPYATWPCYQPVTKGRRLTWIWSFSSSGKWLIPRLHKWVMSCPSAASLREQSLGNIFNWLLSEKMFGFTGQVPQYCMEILGWVTVPTACWDCLFAQQMKNTCRAPLVLVFPFSMAFYRKRKTRGHFSSVPFNPMINKYVLASFWKRTDSDVSAMDLAKDNRIPVICRSSSLLFFPNQKSAHLISFVLYDWFIS